MNILRCRDCGAIVPDEDEDYDKERDSPELCSICNLAQKDGS